MATTRRICVTLTILGLLAGASLWPDPALAQKRVIVGDVSGETSEQTFEGLSIPKDREATAIIAAAADYVKKSDWDTVSRSLQFLLERPEDSFFEVTRKDAKGQEYTTRISIRDEANRLIGSLPAEGLETYRQKYGQRAMVMLQEGIDKNDPAILSQVALKYRHTESGVKAINLLGNYFLDRGNYQLALGKFQELLELLEKEKPEVKKEIGPKTFYKAALAYQRFGDAAMAEKLWKQVVEMVGEKGLQFSAKGKNYTVAELKAELDRNAQVGAKTLAGWPLVRGDSARTAEGVGGIPVMESRWSIDMFRPDPPKDDTDRQERASWLKTADWVQEKVRAATDMIDRTPGIKRSMLPGFFPIAGNNRLIVRTYDGVYAFIIRDDPALGKKAGELDWACGMLRGPLHAMGSDMPGGNRGTAEGWVGEYMTTNQGMAMPGILFENSAVGTLSHDNKYVYVVDDLALPPHPNRMMYGGFNGNSMPFGSFTDPVLFNSLMAIEMDNGRLKWEIGERKPGGKTPVFNPGFVGRRQMVGPDGKIKIVQVNPDGTEVEIDPKTGQPIKKEEPVKPFVPPKEYVKNTNFVNAADELMDCYFLGPPLPIGGKIYVLVEYNGEIQVCCINPLKVEPTKAAKQQGIGPELVWRQPLGTANLKLMQDSMRRMQPCHLAYNDGILVCPTNAGAIIAVNLLTQSLAWAYSYRTGKDPNNMDPNAMMMQGGRRFRGGMEMPVVNMSQERWYPAPPAIVNGTVVFTAPDSNAVVCLSLRDGRRMWSVNRQPGDLYMGGVYNNKVLIVAKDSVRALKLSDGSMAWDRPRPVGMPSGQGVASKGKYYLSCKAGVDNAEPQIVEIDIDTGDAHATKSRRKEIPGNLIFYDGEVISQSITKVATFPQLHVKLAEMDARLKKNPNDPAGLTDRGELHLDKGELIAAVDDLKKALSFNPDPDTRGRARLKLYDTLTELLQKDFNKGEEHLALYKDLCLNEVAGDEKVKRQSAYLTILGKGREAQGKLVEAFDAYMEFGQLNGAKEMVPSVDEPGTLSRPDVWARGRILAMIAKAKPEEKKPLEERVAKQWQEVKKTDDVEKIRGFVKVFGSMFSSGLEATLALAEKLAASATPEDQRQAELYLDVLRRQRDDLSLAAQATEALARFMVKKGLLKDAVLLYRILGTEFKEVKLRDGRTGADVFNELVTDKRFLPYLETSAPIWGAGKMRGEQVTGPFNQMASTYFNVDLDGDVMPFFQQHRLVIQTQTNSGNGLWEVKLIDRATGETKFNYPGLPPNHFITNMGFGGPNASTSGTSRFAQVRGHLLMLTMSHMVYVWDLSNLEKGKQVRPVFERNLLGIGVNPQQQGSQTDSDGTLWIMYADGSRLRVGQAGLLESSYVCLPTREGLVALDPATGNVLWKRDTGSGAHLFGDAEYIFVVESGIDGAPTRTQVVRAADGVTVKVKDFGNLYDPKHRVGIVGRNLLVFDDDDKGGKALRLYDVLAGKELWRQMFPEGSKVVRAHDPGLAGVVHADGTVTILAADTGKALIQVKDPEERVQPEHLNDVRDLVLLQDRDSYYVVLNKGPDNMVQSYPFVTNGLKAMRVHGTIYSFAKASGKLDWYRDDVSNQYLVLENFDELPILIFGTMTQRQNRASGRVEAIEKKTGRLVFDKEVANNGQFHAMLADAKAGLIELQRYDLKIRFTQEGKPGADKSGDKPADTPQPIRGAMRAIPAMPVQGAIQFKVVPALPPPPPPPPVRPPAPAKDK